MNNLKWYFPKTIKEATDLITKEKVLPHAGGAALLLRNLEKLTALSISLIYPYIILKRR